MSPVLAIGMPPAARGSDAPRGLSTTRRGSLGSSSSCASGENVWQMSEKSCSGTYDSCRELRRRSGLQRWTLAVEFTGR